MNAVGARAARTVFGAVGLSAVWLLGAPVPAKADNCKALIDQKGALSAATDQEVIADCVRTGQSWQRVTGTVVAGGGIVVAATGLAGGKAKTSPPPRPPAETTLPKETTETAEQRDKKRDCARLQAEFDAKRAKKDEVLGQVQRGSDLLGRMYAQQARQDEDRTYLTGLRESAMRYLMGAGLVAGAAASVAAASYTLAMATRLAAAASTIGEIGGGMFWTHGVGTTAGATMMRVASQMSVEAVGQRALAYKLMATGGAAGLAGGAVGGSVVQSFMDGGLTSFNESAQVFDRLVTENEQWVDGKGHELEWTVRDLRELAGRLQAECGVTADVGSERVDPGTTLASSPVRRRPAR